MKWERSFVLGSIALAFAACGETPRTRDTWFTRTVGETTPVGSFSVVSAEGVPEIEESELSAVVASARAANGNAEVRTLGWTRTVPLGGPMVTVKFVSHRVAARVRFHRTASFVRRRDSVGHERSSTDRWQQEGALRLHAEVCPPGRSFLVGPEIPAKQVLDISLSGDVSPEVLVQIVDDVAADVPADEVPMWIEARDDGYEMSTVDAKAFHGISGSTLRVVRHGGHWHASLTGTWIN